METNLFFDGAGTVSFTSRRNGIIKIRDEEGLAIVRSPDSDEAVKAFELRGTRFNSYVSVETQRLLSLLGERMRLIFTTGASRERVQGVKPIIPFHLLVCENGTQISDQNLTEDQVWKDFLSDQVALLDQTMQEIQSQVQEEVIVVRREATVTLRNKGLPDNEFVDVVGQLSIPDGLQLVRNSGFIIYPSKAGKANAAKYLSERFSGETIHIGDDFNDIDLFKWVDKAYVLGHAPSPVIQSAQEFGWSISSAWYFRGIEEILSNISK